MRDPSLALQGAIYQTLAADTAVVAAVAGRIFDQWPAADLPAFPYIVIGEVQITADKADCIDGSRCDIDLHVWSREKGSVEAKTIVGAIRGALDEADLDLSPDHHLIEILFDSSRVFRDEDGATSHGVITFRALTEAMA